MFAHFLMAFLLIHEYLFVGDCVFQHYLLHCTYHHDRSARKSRRLEASGGGGRGGAPSVPQPGGGWPLSQRGPECSRGPSCALQSRGWLRPGQGGRGLRMEVAFWWHLLRLPGKCLFSHRAGCGGPAPSPKLLDRRETNLLPAPACG